jgi:MFS family permease
VLADPVPRRLAIVAGLIGSGAGLFVPYLNVFFVRELGASPAVYGWLSAAAIGFRLVGTAAAPRLAARIGPVRAIGWTQLASIPLLLTLGLAPLPVVASAAYLLRGALMNMAVPVQASFTMSVLPSGSRGRGNSLIWLADSLARAASTLAGGALIAVAGYRVPYVLTAVLYAAAAGLLLRWFSASPRHQASSGGEGNAQPTSPAK